jgi:hypothetical protein
MFQVAAIGHSVTDTKGITEIQFIVSGSGDRTQQVLPTTVSDTSRFDKKPSCYVAAIGHFVTNTAHYHRKSSC